MKQLTSLIGRLVLLVPLFASACAAQIPTAFFGVDPNQYSSYPLLVGYGNFRQWDANAAQWAPMHTCPSPYTAAQCQTDPTLSSINWTPLDQDLSANYSAKIHDGVLMTLNRTPNWASQNPSDTQCTLNGGCDPPVNLNADGSGSNNIWDYWVAQIATHANQSSYLTSHAHIKYWEPWNEPFCNSNLGGCGPPFSYRGTYAQLLRITEDTRCIILGQGTIHNYPSAGNSTSCSSYLAGLPSWSNHAAIDVSAQIVVSTLGIGGVAGQAKNEMYCMHPTNDLGTSTSCTWNSTTNPWMSNAVDVMNGHFYAQTDQPENLFPPNASGSLIGAKSCTNTSSRAMNCWLTSTDKAKPLWSGEGSCTGGTSGIWTDAYSQAAFVPRYLALLWSAGVVQSFWFQYNGACSLASGGTTTLAGIAWNETYAWLKGATPVNSPFCSNAGTVWTCALIEANGKPAELVWDSQYGPGGTTAPTSCSTALVPTICGNTPYTVPAPYSADWLDVAGTSHAYTATVTIGAAPILLEGKLPNGGIKLTGTVKLTGKTSLRTQ